MSQWREGTIADVAANRGLVGGPFGSKLVSRDYVDDGIIVIRGQNLSHGRWVTFDDSVYVSRAKADKDLRGNIAESGDLIYTQRGTLGQVAIMPSVEAPAVISQSQMRLRVDTQKANPQFVYYCSIAPGFRQAIADHAIIAGVPHINLGILSDLAIPLPDLSTQGQIAAILGAFDDLIENNRRRVAVLEEMARTIYREWFVKFRYPGHEDVPLVDSALGPIPEGWSVKNLFEIAEVGFGYSFKSSMFSESGQSQLIRIRDIPNGISGTFTDEKADERYAVVDDDVLIGMDGDFHMTVWTGGNAWLNQRVTRLRPKTGMTPLHLLLAIESQIVDWNRAIIGTTVAHLGKKHLELVTVLVPDTGVLQCASNFFGLVTEQRRELIQSSRRLAAIRDLLLPKLVTGVIDVSGLDVDVLMMDRGVS